MREKTSGFTLIGFLIYSVLVTIFLTFALLTMYQIIETNERVQERKMLSDNQRFVLQKIAWALKNVSAINTPAVGGSGTSISVNKLNYPYNPVIITLNGSVLEMTSGATTTPLTTSDITVSTTTFTHRLLSNIDLIEVAAVLESESSSTTLQTSFFVE